MFYISLLYHIVPWNNVQNNIHSTPFQYGKNASRSSKVYNQGRRTKLSEQKVGACGMECQRGF